MGNLICCCCGGKAGKCEQWYNRDIGFGICFDCVKWIKGRGKTSDDEIKTLYGLEGIHWRVEQVEHGKA